LSLRLDWALNFICIVWVQWEAERAAKRAAKAKAAEQQQQ